MKVFLTSLVALIVIGVATSYVLPHVAGESSEAAFTAPSARP